MIEGARHQLNVLNAATVCDCVEAFAARRGAKRLGSTSKTRLHTIWSCTAILRRALRLILSLLDQAIGIAATRIQLEGEGASCH